MGIKRKKICFFTAVAIMLSALPSYSRTLAHERDTVDRHYNIERSVVISSSESRSVKGLLGGDLLLETADLDWLPQILGTPDILKTVQLMPGVTASGEMDSGIYLRGADPGQVAVFFDGARVYFPSHLLNFYSVFNSDHISSASVLKSHVPVSYGGGASGVIDVKSPDRLFEDFEGKASIGIISSQATVSTPVGGKSSLRISGRGTYVNWLLNNINFMRGRAQPDYGFYDANLTWAFRYGDNASVKLNAYHSQDNLAVKMGGLSLDGSLDWTNSAASLSWDSRLGDDIGMKHVAAFSRYDNDVRMHREKINIGLPSGIMDITYRGSVSIPLGQSSIVAGADYVYHRTKVQHPAVEGLYSTGKPQIKKPYHTHEFAAYAEYSRWFSFPLKFNMGLRYSGAVTDGALHCGFEPRLSVWYDFHNGMRLRASAMRQMQYVNTVSVSGMGLPTDFLIPVTEIIKPQSSSSVSLGFAHHFADYGYEYSVEPYFSYLGNALEFDGELFDLIGGDYDTEDHILSGSGMNYGLEFMFKKNFGKVNGWVSYTLSRSLRRFPDIMGGKVFPSEHDRLHNLSCVVNYSPSPCWTFSAVFIYGSGTSYTPPTGLYLIGENLIQEYGDHNSARMPDYNRMDVSVTYDFRPKGRLGHSLNLSVYNVYARNNPLFRDIRPEYDAENPTELDLRLVGVSLYSLLPSISYSLTF